jgi:hypothetical protein
MQNNRKDISMNTTTYRHVCNFLLHTLAYFVVAAITPLAYGQGTGTLDSLMNSSQSARSNAASPVSKASFLADFERDYLAKATDKGTMQGMSQRADKVGDGLAAMLPAEYGVSATCVQQRSRDGRISGNSQARTVAAAMYDVLDQIATSGNKGGMLRDRVNSLSKPYTGCPNDFPAIKQFLDDYAEFAKGMVDRKLALVGERKANEEEKARQVKAAANQKADEQAGKQRDAQAREAEMKRQKKESDEKRKLALRSGSEKPGSFRDYMLMHDHEIGDQYYGSPLRVPDNKVYLFGTGAFDREDSGGLFIRNSGNEYIYVKTSRGTPIYGDLRVNMAIVVIGKYVGNIQYTTVIGAIKTAPVIEAFAISKAPVYY